MASADADLPEIEVITDVVDGGGSDPRGGHAQLVGEVRPVPTTTSRLWFFGITAVVLLGAVGVAIREPPGDGRRPAREATLPTDQVGRDAASEPAGPLSGPPVVGEWQTFPTALRGHHEQGPFMAVVGANRVLLVYTENGGEDVAGEILDLRRRTTEPIAASPLNRRSSPLVGWTGDELVIIGGYTDPAIEVAGAAYDPDTDSWRPIADPPGYVPGSGQGYLIGPGAWTGEELISWQSRLAYDPSTDTWREISPSPLSPRAQAAVTVTASGGVLVWGGCHPDTTDLGRCHSDGALYDPATDTWEMLPDGPLERGAGALAVGTTWADRVIVVVSRPYGLVAPTVAAFDVSTQKWIRLPDLPLESGTSPTSLVWTGTHAAVWSGPDQTGRAGAGHLLNPVIHVPQFAPLDRWRPIPVDRRVPTAYSAAWTRRGLVVAGAGSRAFFAPDPGWPCPGQYDSRDRPYPSPDRLDRLPELGTTIYDNVAATIMENAQDIGDRFAGIIDISVGPGWGVAHEREGEAVEVHRDLDDHIITVRLEGEEFCEDVEPAFFLDSDGRSVPIRFVSDTP